MQIEFIFFDILICGSSDQRDLWKVIAQPNIVISQYTGI